MIGYLTFNDPLVHALQARPAIRRAACAKFPQARFAPTAPSLADYFADGDVIAIKGELDRPIAGLAIDCRRVSPGTVYFALPDLNADGATFIDEAVSRGAVAVVAERMPTIPPARVTFIRVADARVALARVAQRYYEFPDRDLTAVGVTGRTGKTTVAHLIRRFLGGPTPVGLLGTINYDLGARSVPSTGTTPEAVDVFGLMAQMRDAGCRHAVIEVSADGITDKRVLGLHLGAAVFTNLACEAQPGAKSGESEFEIMTRLFSGKNGATPKVAVINSDDPFGVRLLRKLAADRPDVRCVSFGQNSRAQIRAENVGLDLQRSTLRVVWPEGSADVAFPLIGSHNVTNLLAAVATAWALGRDPQVFLADLPASLRIAGRMEQVNEGQSFTVLVDSAKTETELRQALAMLRPITPGKLRVVFGCSGQSDAAERSRAMTAVQELADEAIATADNPGGVKVAEIFDDMRAGVTAPGQIWFIENRREALATALEFCEPGDCLLVAGKGHETTQELADTVFPFDDRLVVRELLHVGAVLA